MIREKIEGRKNYKEDRIRLPKYGFNRSTKRNEDHIIILLLFLQILILEL